MLDLFERLIAEPKSHLVLVPQWADRPTSLTELLFDLGRMFPLSLEPHLTVGEPSGVDWMLESFNVQVRLSRSIYEVKVSR